jgi:chorismate--pyruvate lyase
MSRSSLRYPRRHPDRCWLARLAEAPPLLRDSGSLTAALRARASDFNVRVVAEGWRCAGEDERSLLGVRRGRLVWVREVLLGDGALPLVFAHTVVAGRDLPRWPWLRGLGRRPLGEVLFRHPRVVRLPLRYRRLDARQPLYHAARRAAVFGARSLAARRSLFVLDGRPLLVTEIFLPALLQGLDSE